MRQKNYSQFIFLTILLLSLLNGCQKTKGTQSIDIGILISLTGAAAGFGEDLSNGVQLAAEEINKAGGINGRPIRLIIEDDATDSVRAVTAFQKLVNVDNVEAIIGGTWDFNYNAIAPLAKEYKITLITPQNVKTTGLIINDFTFVMRPEMQKSVGSFEDYFKEQHIVRVAIVKFNSPFGQDIASGLHQVLERIGGSLVLDETYNSIGGNDFLTVVSKLKSQHPDAVFIDMVGPDFVNFVRHAKEQELSAKILSHGVVADILSMPSVNRDLLEGIVYFTWDIPLSKEFQERFISRFHKDPGHSADGAYNALISLADALKNVDSKGIPSYLETHTIQTINGNVRFKDHVIDSGTVLVRQVQKDGLKTLSTTQVLG